MVFGKFSFGGTITSIIKLLRHRIAGSIFLPSSDITAVVVGERCEEMPHVNHIVGYVNAGDDDGDHVVNF